MKWSRFLSGVVLEVCGFRVTQFLFHGFALQVFVFGPFCSCCCSFLVKELRGDSGCRGLSRSNGKRSDHVLPRRERRGVGKVC